MTQAEQLAAQAAQWHAAGRPDMAVQLYTASLDQDPTKFAVRMQLAECLVYLQQTDQAAEQYLMVAQAYAARGYHAECLAICERIITVAPQAFVYMSVGPMVRRIGRHARPLCAKAAELHLAAGRQTDGLQILRLGAELDPHNPEVRRQLAKIFAARHMKREAVDALSDAGNLLIQAKRYDEYVEVAQQILALEPRDLNTLRDLPRVYLELGKPHEAVRTLGQLTKVSPGDISGYEVLAQAFASIGRTDKSLSVLQRLVGELGATGQGDKADAILNHARYWRPTDLVFMKALKAMEVPKPKPVAHSAPRSAPMPEGTVVLSIADLVIDDSGSHKRPSRNDAAVRLIEAEGTLTLDLEELILFEESKAKAAAPTRPSPGSSSRPSTSPPPPPTRPPPGDATVSLEGSGVIAMLDAYEEIDGVELVDSVVSERPTVPEMPAMPAEPIASPPARTPASPVADKAKGRGGRAISELIYDDDDEDEGEPATRLHMRPLTAEDIMRAQRRAQVDLDAPTVAPPGRGLGSNDEPTIAPSGRGYGEDASTVAPPGRAPAFGDDASTVPPAVRSRAPAEQAPTWPPSPPAAVHHDGDEATRMTPLRSMSGRAASEDAVTVPPPGANDLDEPTLGPSHSDSTLTGGMGDDAPTMARMQPLTAADIARALAKANQATPPPEIPMPTLDDARTRVPAGRPSPPAPVAPPQPPPLLTPAAASRGEEEEDLTVVRMDALTPEDIERALRARNRER